MTDLANFTDENLDRSLRRRAEYDDNEPGNLVLKVPTQAGGYLTLPLVERARSNLEQEQYQENTLLRIKPLAEIQSNLPVKSGGLTFHTGRSVALLRPGYLYVFRGNTLWRELEINTEGMMSDVDVQSARFEWETEPSESFRARPSVGEWQHDILVPAMLQGQTVIQDIRVAYSEVQWDWHYVRWLEQDAKALRIRTTRIDHAWPAALVDDINFASGYPASPIQQVDGLRARDLGIELMLENPSDFKEGFEGPGEGELCIKLGRVLRENVHAADSTEAIAPMDLTCEPREDLVSDIRRHKGLVCVAIPDPLFRMRHSLAQLHIALHYLDAIDVAIQENPMAHSAMLIRQAVFDPLPSGEPSALVRYAEAIDRDKLDETLKTTEKQHAIRIIEAHVQKLESLMEGNVLGSVLGDYQACTDVAICEAYLLLADQLNVLQQIPGVVKAQGMFLDHDALRSLKDWVLKDEFLNAWAPQPELGEETDANSDFTSAFDRLQQLALDQREIDETLLNRLNLQSLAYLEKQLDEQQKGENRLAKNVSDGGKVGALISRSLEEWSSALLAVCKRLVEEDAIQQIEVQRVMQAASSNFVLADPDLKGIEVMERTGAVSNGTILGVSGNGLNRGLTDFDRTEGVLTRAKDYLYADMVDDAGGVVASTSTARAADELEVAIQKVAGGTMMFFVPADHPEAKKLSLVKVDFAKRVGEVVDGPAVSRGLVVLAAFNVFIEARTIAAIGKRRDGTFALLPISKTMAALTDLLAASLKLSMVLAEGRGASTGFSRFAARPLFDVKNWLLIGNRLRSLGASTLVRTTGLVSFIAGGIGAFLSYWEMRISMSHRDFDAAVGHAIAMTGGLIFLAQPLMGSLLAIPGWGWAILGMAMVVGGTLYAGSVTDDAFEQLLKRGPWGTESDHPPRGQDEKSYYGQLLTLLSPVDVAVKKYRDVDPDPALSHPDHPPEPNDYVVTIQFPLISRLKLDQTSQPSLPSSAFNLVIQEVAYTASTIETFGSLGSVDDFNLCGTTRLRKVAARQSLPQHSAVRFLVKRELESSEYSSFGYHESITTTVRVGLQAVIDTELGALVFPTPVNVNYESFEVARHGNPPPKVRTLFNPYDQPESPYWYFAEVAT
ncbi:toxin VasX [Marinobacter sp.]|uniref:toxin VasX n=1 Tax=Marinobacter sp. TaxID=50741 RepID=UPI0035679AC6